MGSAIRARSASWCLARPAFPKVCSSCAPAGNVIDLWLMAESHFPLEFASGSIRLPGTGLRASCAAILSLGLPIGCRA